MTILPIGINKPMPPKRNRRYAFTLLELLIVVTIIAALAALLMPALATAKDRAKTVKCAHTQKQLAGAFTQYLNDNNGFFPYIYPSCWIYPGYSCVAGTEFACTNSCGGGAYCYTSFGWNVLLAPYYGYQTSAIAAWSLRSFCGQGGPPCTACNFDPNIQRTVKAFAPNLQCSANPWPIKVYCDPGYVAYPGVSSAGWVQPVWRMMATSYAMNGNMFPVDFRPGAGPCTNNAGWTKRVNMADIKNPASVALLGEMPWCNWAAPNPPNVWGLAYLPGQWYMTAALTSNSTVASQWRKPTPSTYCNAYVAAWHGSAMNTLFPDGHVERVPQSTLYLYSDQFTKGQAASPGGIFWNDGKPSGWYNNQFPGWNYPN